MWLWVDADEDVARSAERVLRRQQSPGAGCAGAPARKFETPRPTVADGVQASVD